MTTGTTVVFDAEAVRSLTGHPDDAAFAVVFVTRYRRLLAGRVRRIAQAVREDVLAGAAVTADAPADAPADALADAPADALADALDAVLSLAVASATVGARELGELGCRIEAHLRAGDPAAAITAVGLLPEAADRAGRALDEFLASRPAPDYSASSIR